MKDIQAKEEVPALKREYPPLLIGVVGKDPRQVEPGNFWPGKTWSDPEPK
jgi:hypothetical protein